MDNLELLTFIDPEQLPYGLLVIVLALIANRVLTRSLDALGERLTDRRLLFKQVSAVARFVVILLATVLVVGAVFRLSDQALLTIGGSAAVAIGFAFKDLLASLMAGLILLFDRPFQVGDRVEFGGQYGEVVEIGLRTVRIATLDDNLISIPNNRFLSDVVACANAGALDQMCVHRFFLEPGQDLDLALRLVREAALSSRDVYLNKPVTVGARQGPLGAGWTFGTELTLRAYVLDGRRELHFATELTRRVLAAFQAHGLRTVGEAAPAQMPPP